MAVQVSRRVTDQVRSWVGVASPSPMPNPSRQVVGSPTTGGSAQHSISQDATNSSTVNAWFMSVARALD